MILIKICGLTDADAIRAAVEAGADAIGFVFAESVRKISPTDAKKLAADIPSSVQKVAVMKNPTDAEWDEVWDVFQPDVLQADLVDIAMLDVTFSVSVWPVFREGLDTLNRRIPSCFVYEGQKSGSGQVVDWQEAADYTRHGNMILAGGLDADNVGQAIGIVGPYGVDVSSGVEVEPGRKDPDKIKAFIDAVRQAE